MSPENIERNYLPMTFKFYELPQKNTPFQMLLHTKGVYCLISVVYSLSHTQIITPNKPSVENESPEYRVSSKGIFFKKQEERETWQILIQFINSSLKITIIINNNSPLLPYTSWGWVLRSLIRLILFPCGRWRCVASISFRSNQCIHVGKVKF